MATKTAKKFLHGEIRSRFSVDTSRAARLCGDEKCRGIVELLSDELSEEQFVALHIGRLLEFREHIEVRLLHRDGGL